MFTLLMLIAHTISDFILQTKEIVKIKSELKPKGFIKHGFIVFLTSVTFILGTDFTVIKSLIWICVLHILIDLIKEVALKILKTKYVSDDFKLNGAKLTLFILDQVIHIGIIIKITKDVTLAYGVVNDIMISFLYSDKIINVVDLKILFIILYVTFSGAYLVPLVLNLIYTKIPDYNQKLNNIIKSEIENSDEHKFIDEVGTGKWIGILERSLMLIFIFANQLAALGVVVTVKSLARFKMMDNKIFSEYYLLGTLLSVVYTVGGYYLLNRLL